MKARVKASESFEIWKVGTKPEPDWIKFAFMYKKIRDGFDGGKKTYWLFRNTLDRPVTFQDDDYVRNGVFMDELEVIPKEQFDKKYELLS